VIDASVSVAEEPKKQVRFEEPTEDLGDDQDDDDLPELPFQEVTPVTRVPRREPVPLKTAHGVVEPIPDLSRRGPAYRVKAPIERDDIVKEVIDKVLKTVVHDIDIGAILGASEPTRKELSRLLAKRRTKAESNILESLEDSSVPDDVFPFASDLGDEDDVYLRRDAISIDDLPPAKVLLATVRNVHQIPAGALIVDDPVLQYLSSLKPGEEAKQIIVAKDSTSLRSVYPLINGVKSEESVTDGGSQIVSMAEEVAKDLGLAWDPDIRIHMQSANNQVEMTLGLARNVPFLFGDITVYLQVHIIKGPAYKVLLGRPFDVVTESVVANSADGGQTITIKDPNTGRRSTILTYTRGSDPAIAQRKPKEGF
jgi:hypothetical protein